MNYLEGTHAGEFMSASLKDIEANIRESSTSDDYKDPTEMLPESPPPPCLNDACNACNQCTDLESWWSHFHPVINMLLFKSNLHRCSSTKNKDDSQNKGRAFKGCLDNIYEKCKARFPCLVYEQTEVDPESGSVLMKKTEQWLNTFTYLVTYLLRCNTDVTSLCSGTAIKAVLLYVTNYVTKSPLKTYAIFDTIRSIFERNPDVVVGGESAKEKARKLMTKIVNSLSTKMEMGNPMICMYMLGSPDHYKSHEFQVFYWISFITTARSPWVKVDSSICNEVPKADGTYLDSEVAWRGQPDVEGLDGTEQPNEKVAIIEYNNRFVGLSPMQDYIYRYEALRNMSLYDWVARCKRMKLTNRHTSRIRMTKDRDDSVSESELSVDECLLSRPSFPISGNMSNVFSFLSDHPLAKSHGTRCRPVGKEKIPNFVGPTLPRCDQGNREFYCSVMLTLFKPWRSGLELKTQEESWDDAFGIHRFSDRERKIMRNLNIRYECLDAQDDFHAQLTKGEVGLGLWEDADMQAMHDMEGIAVDGIDIIQDDAKMKHHVHELSEELGKCEKARACLMSEIRSTLQNLGWTENSPGLLHLTIDVSPPLPEVKLNGAVWKTVVAEKHAEVLQLHA